MRVFLGDPSVEITKCSYLYLRRRTCGLCCFEFLWELGVVVRPREASVIARVVIAGTREGLAGPEF